MAGGGIPIQTNVVNDGYLTGRKLIYPICLITSLFFLWGFSYGLLDVLNKHFQTVLGITKLESTGLQVVYFGGGYLCFSPVAAEVMKRKGYKIAVLMGLALYSLGAVMFWPTAHFSSPERATASFGGFIACTFVIACGLATLETAANSYAVVIGNPKSASARLQFCQSWNGVASFIGPLIASKFFFSGENANNLTNVQFVYLAVACAGVAVAVLFALSKMPEISEANIEATQATDAYGNEAGSGPLYKQYNMIFGVVAQFVSACLSLRVPQKLR
jgi:FHS family L-fucose permease-like MFS transporter